MKEVLGSLPEVITAYKNYNLLVPTATDVQLNPFYKFHVEEVPVDLGENSGDIFKVGSVKTGKQDEKGKDIWEDVFSLSKPLLNKMAMAAGIQFNPRAVRGGKAASFGHMCHSCFAKWLTSHNIPVPDLENKKEIEDGKEKL